MEIVIVKNVILNHEIVVNIIPINEFMVDNEHESSGIFEGDGNISVSTHMQKISIRIRASPYRYGTPYLYGDFFDTVHLFLNIGPHTGIVNNSNTPVWAYPHQGPIVTIHV